MADVTANAVNIFEEGLGQKVVLYRVRNVDTADTISVAGEFVNVEVAVAFGSIKWEIVVSGEPATTLTMTLAGVSNETVYLLVLGQAAV